MPCERHARCVRRDKNGVVHCPLDHSDKNPSNESRREIFHQAELLGIFEIPRERVSALLEMSIDMSALLGRKRMALTQDQPGQNIMLAAIPNDGHPDLLNLG